MASANSASKKRSIGAPSQQQGSVSCALGKCPYIWKKQNGMVRRKELDCAASMDCVQHGGWLGKEKTQAGGRRGPMQVRSMVDPEWDSRVKKTLAGMWDMVDRGVKREASIQADMFKAFALKD
uniref:Uncharacterized protein n=1 Tax=Oryza meridionalis TaxID=40149 RepID=A0A0E0F7V4_9ORYZ